MSPRPLDSNRIGLSDLGALVYLGAVWGAAFLFFRVASPEVGPVWTAEIRIALAGGFTDKAAPGRVRVIRSTPGGQQAISVDMNDIIKRGQRDQAFRLQENDVVVVPESFF